MNTGSPDNQNRMQVHLEEYKSLRSETNARLAHQDRLLHWSLIFFAALSGLLFGFTGRLSTLMDSGLQWVLLFIPMAYIAICFDYQSQYFMMAHLGRYINSSIRPKLGSLLGLPKKEIIAWEDYLDEAREQSGLVEKIAWNARYIIIFAMALIWWLFFILITLAYFKVTWGLADWVLVIVEGLALISLLYSNVPIVSKFRQITASSPKSGKPPEHKSNNSEGS